MSNRVEHGKTPLLTAVQLGRIGFRLIAFRMTGLTAAARTFVEAMRHLKETGTSTGLKERMLSFGQFTNMVRLQAYQELERLFYVAPS